MAHLAVGEANENRGIFGLLPLGLHHMVGVVQADAENLFGIRHRRQMGDRIQLVVGLRAGKRRLGLGQPVLGQQVPHVGEFRQARA